MGAFGSRRPSSDDAKPVIDEGGGTGIAWPDQSLFGQTVVIKYGGSAMEKPGLRDLFSRDIALVRTLGARPVVVHGGGPQIDRLMKRLGKSPHFVGGLRVTDDETMNIVEMVLAGSINKEIVASISAHGGRAVGLCGGDAGLIRADRRRHMLPDGRESSRPGGTSGAVDTVARSSSALRAGSR